MATASRKPCSASEDSIAQLLRVESRPSVRVTPSTAGFFVLSSPSPPPRSSSNPARPRSPDGRSYGSSRGVAARCNTPKLPLLRDAAPASPSAGGGRPWTLYLLLSCTLFVGLHVYSGPPPPPPPWEARGPDSTTPLPPSLPREPLYSCPSITAEARCTMLKPAGLGETNRKIRLCWKIIDGDGSLTQSQSLQELRRPRRMFSSRDVRAPLVRAHDMRGDEEKRG
ncbi:hypothetical protein GGR52DRAFT_469174 [Hypoxylon sp. FL1284]|nr:hypothetical protein GGR52DRAFT_469174 [Hypoxylon sp. FL1284]